MDSFSTVNVLMNTYTTIYELHGQLRTIEMVKASIAYPLVEIRLDNWLPPLAAECTEYDYFIIDGTTPRAGISFAFATQGLVNFDVQVYPKEFFKKRAITKALRFRLLPYVAAKAKAHWEVGPFGLLLRDLERDLVHNVRWAFTRLVSVSASIVAAEFAGI